MAPRLPLFSRSGQPGMVEPRGLLVGAPRSGSGKTLLTLGLLAALARRGAPAAPAKTGPDYIDLSILARAASRPAINLDPWAMGAPLLRRLAHAHAAETGLLLVEGVMGLFDGARDGVGSSADLAAALGIPVLLVVDAERQSQSVAALVSGFARWRADIHVAGVVLNRVGSPRHEAMLRAALAWTGIPCLGALPRDPALVLPERHLGLVLPDEIEGFSALLDHAAARIAAHLDLAAILALAAPLRPESAPVPPPVLSPLPPPGQIVAIARDRAFAFLYPHLLEGWRAAGAELLFFSPLADEPPAPHADAVFLPGGYPELHAEALAAAEAFRAGLHAARDRGALVYGECGGFMALGEGLIDRDGRAHRMAGLLPLTTRIDRPRRVLGYRRLAQDGALPFPRHLLGHEFHYSSAAPTGLSPLFSATEADGAPLPPMGAVLGRVMGSYAHLICHDADRAGVA